MSEPSDLLTAREIAATIEEERIAALEEPRHIAIALSNADGIRAGRGDHMPAVIAAMRAFELRSLVVVASAPRQP